MGTDESSVISASARLNRPPAWADEFARQADELKQIQATWAVKSHGPLRDLNNPAFSPSAKELLPPAPPKPPLSSMSVISQIIENRTASAMARPVLSDDIVRTLQEERAKLAQALKPEPAPHLALGTIRSFVPSTQRLTGIGSQRHTLH